MAAAFDMVRLSSRRMGDVDICVSIEEVHHDELQITEHPVERGAAITDHAFKRPSEVVIKCGWSNADYAALNETRLSLQSGAGLPGETYVDGVYKRLLKLQSDRVPFDVTTSRRQYKNMLLQGLVVTTDAKTSGALMVTATCREVIIVSTKAAVLPERADQADPKATAEIVDRGAQAAVPGVPSPGGSAPAETWKGPRP